MNIDIATTVADTQSRRAPSSGTGAGAKAVPVAAQEQQARPAVEPETAQPVQPPPTAKAVQAAAAQIESFLRRMDKSLEFQVDAATGQTVVTVRDSTTGAVVRQIPGEEALRIAHVLEDQSSALLDVMA